MKGKRIYRLVWAENGMTHAFSFFENQCGIAFARAYKLRDKGYHGYLTSERESSLCINRHMWDIAIIYEF